ncbi:MAG: DUF190 domain-containing protein [Nitrospinota bacterium]
MKISEKGHLLRIFIGEQDSYENMPLYEWIVRRARKNGLAGATVLRGVEGFGAKSRLHTAKILQLSMDLPVIVEIVDSKKKIEEFMKVIEHAISDGLATLEDVEIFFYRAGNGNQRLEGSDEKSQL